MIYVRKTQILVIFVSTRQTTVDFYSNTVVLLGAASFVPPTVPKYEIECMFSINKAPLHICIILVALLSWP